MDATRDRPADFYRVVSLDSDLKESLDVDNVKRRVDNDLLQVQVTLRSTTSRALALETSWEWFDKGGFRIDDGRTAWTPILVGPRATVDVRSVAPRPGVEAFKFHVRTSHPITEDDLE